MCAGLQRIDTKHYSKGFLWCYLPGNFGMETWNKNTGMSYLSIIACLYNHLGVFLCLIVSCVHVPTSLPAVLSLCPFLDLVHPGL